MPIPASEPASQAGPDRGLDPPSLPADESFPLLTGALCRAVPEFVTRYLTLVDGCGDDPGEPLVLMELADFVSERMATVHSDRSVLGRAFATIEAHLESIAQDAIACEFVAFAFFDSFTPELRQRMVHEVGPRSRRLIEALDHPNTEWESDW
jgi:hypothetical protein